MKYDIEDLYPTPVYFSRAHNLDFIQNEIKSSIEKTEFKMNDEWNSHYLSDIKFKQNILMENPFEYFLMELDYHIRQYATELNFTMRDYRVVESWISMFQKGNYGHIHSHGTSDLSGVYYYQTNEKDGNLFFECPVPNIPSSIIMYESNCRRWISPPSVGKIVLFPGWLKHGIETNTTDHTRISLSFNIDFDRSLT